MTRFMVVLAIVALGGCAASSRHLPHAIHHAVFIDLADPADAAELASDCGELGQIPGVSAWAVGVPIDTGRTTVDANYDVGLYVGFATPTAYQAYLDHPIHTNLVAKWRARWTSILIRDFGHR